MWRWIVSALGFDTRPPLPPGVVRTQAEVAKHFAVSDRLVRHWRTEWSSACQTADGYDVTVIDEWRRSRELPH